MGGGDEKNRSALESSAKSQPVMFGPGAEHSLSSPFSGATGAFTMALHGVAPLLRETWTETPGVGALTLCFDVV